MAPTSIVDLLNVLNKGGDFGGLVGLEEGHEVDFKKQPYDINSNKGKWELAKDVAAFANSAGGCIVVGAKTKQERSAAVEKIDRVSRVPKDRVDVPRYRDVLRDWLTPSVRGVDIRWYPDDDQESDGILLIRVPAAAEREKPIIVRRVVDPDGKVVSAFGIPERNQDRIEWISAEAIHQRLILAKALQGLQLAVGRAEQDLTRSLGAKARIALLRKLAECTDEPCIVLQAAPVETENLIEHMYGPAGIQGLVATWTGTRRDGFDLETNRDPAIVDGNVVFSRMGWRAQVSRDGWVDFVAPVNFDFLCWAMEKAVSTTSSLPINPFPLVEITYDFFRFVRHVVAPFAPSSSWSGHVHALGLKSGNALLQPGRPGRIGADRMGATSDDWNEDFAISLDHPRDAYEALKRIYALFAIPPEGIPFARDGGVVEEELGKK